MQASLSSSCENESSADICQPLGFNNGNNYNGGYWFIPNFAGIYIDIYAHSVRAFSSLEEHILDTSSAETGEGAIYIAEK